MIRALIAADLPAVKHVIDANELFPSEMIDEMAFPFLHGAGSGERWLTTIVSVPIAVAYFAMERMTEGTWNLLLIAVHPDHHGKGIGSALQRQVERELAEAGQRILLVETSGLAAFSRTRRFYRLRGYAEEARVRDFYEDGNDKIIFHKRL